ncbi:MAG: TolC family protein [Bacteroidetes bacterium]|nr:TolC family protein [Bacteroidota bacterium]
MKQIKLLIIPFIISHSLFAQTKLSLNEAIQLGLKNNKSIQNSLLKKDIAENKVKEVGSQFFPSLKLNAQYNRLSEVDKFIIPLQTPVEFPVILNSYSSRIYFQQPIFTGFKLSSLSKSSEHIFNATFSEMEKETNEIVLNIIIAYWNLFRAIENQKLLEENIVLVKSLVLDSENLLKQGLSTANDLLKSKLHLSSVELQANNAKNNLILSELVFKKLISAENKHDLTLNDKPSENVNIDLEIDKIFLEANQNRKDFKITNERILSAETQITSAKSNWYPNIYLLGGYNYSRPNPRIFPAKDEAKGTWDIGISMQFEIWNNFNSNYQIESSELQHQQLINSKELLRNSIEIEVASNYLNFNQLKKNLEYANLSLEQAAENLRSTKAKKISGLVSGSEIINAEILLQQSKINKINSVVDLIITEAKLKNSIGRNLVNE